MGRCHAVCRNEEGRTLHINQWEKEKRGVAVRQSQWEECTVDTQERRKKKCPRHAPPCRGVDERSGCGCDPAPTHTSHVPSINESGAVKITHGSQAQRVHLWVLV